jgi:hypothetical protein
VTNRFWPLAGATLALVLAACGPSAATPVATTDKPTGGRTVAASGAGIWFAPAPAKAHDLLALVEPNAPWAHAAAATSVFQLSASSIAALSDADLATLVSGLKRLGLPIAVLVPALTPVGGCGQIPGSPDATTAPDLLRRVKVAGGAVRFIAMDSPAAAGTQCRLSAMEIATNVGAWSAGVRAVVPGAPIGDAEPVADASAVSAYADWMPAYATVTGSPLAFVHLDLDWSQADWPTEVGQVAALAQQAGAGFGIVNRGNVDDTSDAAWSAHAADRMAAVASAGAHLDSPIFQSVAARSPRLLPETDDTTLTALVTRYAGTRSALTMDRPSPASDGSQLVGARLLDASGKPIAGATVDLTIRSLYAPGEFAQYTATGTIPAGVDHGVVGLRVGTEGADAGPADLMLYRASYQEGASGTERVANPDFADGIVHWGSSTNGDLLHIEPSDRGGGQMLHVADSAALPLRLISDSFSVTPGATYKVTFSARLTPISRGYFTILFIRGTEVSRAIIRFTPTVVHQSAVTDASGRLQWRVPASAFPAELDARYPGDGTRWPASVTA